MTFRLSKETRDALSETQSLLEQELLDHRDVWDSRSERWQDGDAGTEAMAWIEELTMLIESIDDLPREAQ
jgi:hypothetical protein